MITIGTLKNLEYPHYIGRNGNSSLGNPFAAAGNTVANVVMGYRAYLALVILRDFEPGLAAWQAQKENPELKLHISSGWKVPSSAQMKEEIQGLLDILEEGKPLQLACHCYTKFFEWDGKYQYRCHAEPIAGLLTWQLGEGKLNIDGRCDPCDRPEYEDIVGKVLGR